MVNNKINKYMKYNKCCLIILLVCIVAFIITLIIINVNPNKNKKKTEKEKMNTELSTDKMIALLKYARPVLTHSDSLEIGSITDEDMITFAGYYISLDNNKNLNYFDEYKTANITDIEEAISYIFDEQVDYSKVSFKVENNIIYIPKCYISTDMQVYKFNKRVYDEKQQVYISYIDCLEMGPSRYTELSPDSVTEYDRDSVVNTLVFKYRIKDGRKVLLAFDSVINT